MQVELYERETKELTPEQEIELIEQDQRIKLAEVLGLKGQVQRAAGRKQEIFARFPLLQGEDEAVWRQFLPTRYGDPGRRLREYRFDLIPISVLQLWTSLVAEKAFSSYEIWTPERQQTDPILLGRTDNAGPFLIARWGESLKPFDEIRREVQERRPETVITAPSDYTRGTAKNDSTTLGWTTHTITVGANTTDGSGGAVTGFSTAAAT